MFGAIISLLIGIITFAPLHSNSFQGFELLANKQPYESQVNWPSLFDIVTNKDGVIDLLKDNRTVQRKPKLRDLTKNPVVDLDECSCRNTRIRNPGIRQWVENEIIKVITSKYPNKTSLLTYTSTGSGKLFQDLIMLSRLIKEGYKQIRYILIDDSFQPLIRVLKSNNFSHLDLFGSYSENHPIRIFGNDSKMQQINDRFVQFARYFENIKGSCSLQILAYGKQQTLCDTYVADCAQNSTLKSDIVVGIDIEEGASFEKVESSLDGMVSDRGIFFLYMQSGRTVRDDTDRKNALLFGDWWQKTEHSLLEQMGTEMFMHWLADSFIEHDE